MKNVIETPSGQCFKEKFDNFLGKALFFFWIHRYFKGDVKAKPQESKN